MVDQTVPGTRLPAEPSQRIDARALKAWRVQGLLQSAMIVLFAAATGLGLWQLGIVWWIAAIAPVLAVIVSIALIWIVPAVRWRHWRYEVSEQQLDLQRGIIILTRTLVPMVRVQHVDTRQGPILRRYGLASVEISTAAGTQEIPALALDVADDLRNRISLLAGVAEDV
ncbi:PH domain-containing protein [soil metagenome]